MFLLLLAFTLVLQHIISTNCSQGNSHILNLKLFIKNKILHIYIAIDFVHYYILLNSFNLCYILLETIGKLFYFDYNQKLYQCYQLIITNSNHIVLSYIWSYLTMSNLTKLEFVALEISWKNYLSWILDADIHLDAMNLRVMIKEGNQASL